MSAQQKLELQPDRMIRSDPLAFVMVVLQANLGELARIPGQVWRQAPAANAFRIVTVGYFITCPFGSSDIFTTQSGDPALAESVEPLRIKAPIRERLARNMMDQAVTEDVLAVVERGVAVGVTAERPRLQTPQHPLFHF